MHPVAVKLENEEVKRRAFTELLDLRRKLPALVVTSDIYEAAALTALGFTELTRVEQKDTVQGVVVAQGTMIAFTNPSRELHISELAELISGLIENNVEA